jgi:hypothetical protein
MLFKMISMLTLLTNVLSGPGSIAPIDPIDPIGPIGGQLDDHNCIAGAGYSWCEERQECIRQWLTPCADLVMGPGPMIPMIPGPLISDPMIPEQPYPILTGTHHSVCSELQVAVYSMCNSNCQSCDFYDTRSVLNDCYTDDGALASDSLCNIDHVSECAIPYTECDYDYVCPKVTEVTQCSQGGIKGYTTYLLSLVIHSPNVKNIYAVFGDDQPTEHPMIIPPAYQGSKIFNTNIGGIAPELIAINNDARYDSWITIGITGGDSRDQLSTVGIDFNSWTEEEGISITDGAVFATDPNLIMYQNEYVVAQLTIPNEVVTDVVLNVQGKLKSGNGIEDTWDQKQIVFHLERPQRQNPNSIPRNCLSWHDGCNSCEVRNGVLGACTRMMCFIEDEPKCLLFDDLSGH